MAAHHEVRPVTLGWQAWSIVLVVLVLVTLAGMLILVW